MNVWQMIKESVNALNTDVVTRTQIKGYIFDHFGTVNPKTIDAWITVCCVNQPARVNCYQNSKPRIANGPYDFLFSTGRGQLTRYDSAKHGIWEIAIQNGHPMVRGLDGSGESLPELIVKSTAVNRMKKNKDQSDINKPNPEEIVRYLTKWKTLENYTAQESAINKLFGIYPLNNDLDDVLVKVASLNTFYSTNIFSVFVVARHIVSLDFDKRLAQGDEKLVNDLAHMKIGNAERNLFSFATKYCCHHRPDEYPIYDSFVADVLSYFSSIDSFASFNKNELRDFHVFKEALIKFKQYYALDSFSLREIDFYLWQLGKEKFPKSYGRQKKNGQSK